MQHSHPYMTLYRADIFFNCGGNNRKESPSEIICPIALKTFFGKPYDQNSTKYGVGGALGSRADAVKLYKNSKHKWKKDLKASKQKNKRLYSITKKFGSHCELKKIKNIRSKYSNKRINYSSEYSNDESYSDSPPIQKYQPR